MKISGRTAVTIFIVLVVLVFVQDFYAKYSPEGKRYEARVLAIYNNLEYPPYSKEIGYTMNRRDIRRWITVKIYSEMAQQEVIQYYDEFFQKKGMKKKVSYNKEGNPFYNYKMDDYSITVHPLEDGLIQITIILDYNWE